MLKFSTLTKPLARIISGRIEKWKKRPLECQQEVFDHIITSATGTAFGKKNGFVDIKDFNTYSERVPVVGYEEIRPWIDRIIAGEKDILWPGRPVYFAKTSGTTSGVKYIPITKESIPNHFNTARDALMNYMHQSGNFKLMDGRLIFLSGSPILKNTGPIPTGRLSGISNHMVPRYLKSRQVPTFKTNCIEDWEIKLDHIIEETLPLPMSLISGIPPWVQMYFEKLIEKTGKHTVGEIFPDFSVFVYGGVNYAPYRNTLETLMGGNVDSVETYPASEGFVAFQDQLNSDELLLNVNSGIFFEFIPMDEIHNENPKRLWLGEVETGVNYAVIINSNAGLWGYNLGDMVEFTSLNPFRLRVAGRVAHYISAFGEHVISKEVEDALMKTANEYGVDIIEFTVAPQVNPIGNDKPYHEWFIAFENFPPDMHLFAKKVDEELCEQNIYYKDLIAGKILQPLKIRPLQKDAFRNYMKSIGKLGGQNKVPRLANDRKVADALDQYRI
jgi:hypothetical protein